MLKSNPPIRRVAALDIAADPLPGLSMLSHDPHAHFSERRLLKKGRKCAMRFHEINLRVGPKETRSVPDVHATRTAGMFRHNVSDYAPHGRIEKREPAIRTAHPQLL